MQGTTKKILMVAAAVLLLLGIGFGGYFLSRSYFKKSAQNESGQRQAVFLTNGQVYFAYIYNEGEPTVKLTDVYYLKTNSSLKGDKDGKISLVKMGSEIYGPEDTIFVNRDHILFHEAIRDNSKINDAINKYVSQR